MFHDVHALADSHFKRMKIATKEDSFAHCAQFSADFGDGMMYIAARKTPPDGIADVPGGREVI
jgi:hypothetical protein